MTGGAWFRPLQNLWLGRGLGTNVYNAKIVVGSFVLYSVAQTRGSIRNPCYEIWE